EASLPLLLADSVRPPDVLRFIADHPGVAWNIRPLPALPTLRHKIEDIVEVLGADDALWWSRERVDYLLDQMSVRHRHRVDEAITKPVLTYFTVFRRIRNGKSMAEVRSDGIAGCLRTPRGGSGRQILVRVGNGEVRVRLLSARECASLMGATDYKLNVPLNQALFGFGDAVCVPVIKWIAENYLNPYLNETNHATVNEHRLVPQQPVEQKVNAA
ncbi:MAG: DNA cytosine methyltransferase, partial [Armatimonadota bacterium]